ncbi:DUF1476 domain-containing protein [Methylocapsa sp. S129]|uniref:DUF1476 domain-containing protein n=1 Tax=Methylocapsa sp. S129 TaxID=1641869 RepID=UPI00131E080C|nr:DUF1476 domain-containing protein [Methylocapsa sp. S129]
MNSFEERQKGFEAQFVRDQELSFRVAARRNKLLGLWAAERLGLPAGEAAETYAQTIVAADFQAPGDDDVIKKLHDDFAAKGVGVSQTELRAELARAATEAYKQLTER